MWRWTRKDEDRPAPIASAVPPVRSISSEESVQAVPGLQSVEFPPRCNTYRKVDRIKGEASGSENVYLDGKLEGSVECHAARAYHLAHHMQASARFNIFLPLWDTLLGSMGN